MKELFASIAALLFLCSASWGLPPGSPDTDNRFPSVVRIEVGQDRFCTGVVLFPHTVLTTVPCVAERGLFEPRQDVTVVVDHAGGRRYQARRVLAEKIALEAIADNFSRIGVPLFNIAAIITADAIDVPLPRHFGELIDWRAVSKTFAGDVLTGNRSALAMMMMSGYARLEETGAQLVVAGFENRKTTCPGDCRSERHSIQISSARIGAPNKCTTDESARTNKGTAIEGFILCFTPEGTNARIAEFEDNGAAIFAVSPRAPPVLVGLIAEPNWNPKSNARFHGSLTNLLATNGNLILRAAEASGDVQAALKQEIKSAGYLGVSLDSIPAGLADAYGVPTLKGAFIKTAHPDGPAKRAGIKDGDILEAIDDFPILDSSFVSRIIQSKSGGTETVLTIRRVDGLHQITVKLGELKLAR